MVGVVMAFVFVMKDGQVWIVRSGNAFLDVNNMDIATMVLVCVIRVGMAKTVILVCLFVLIKYECYVKQFK